jgi:MHS family citrate/tricarballylate:H+ symporter-like MFS transporter
MNPESGAANSISTLDASPDRGMRFPLRKALAVGIGNALEFYDFLTFSYFAVQIGRAFFPESQTSHGLLFSLATFGLGFITRPLGGVVIGTYGDRVGRRAAMLLSFSLMGIAIVGLALTPSFARIGMAAPILLLLFRLIQGFALGGEVGPSTAFLIEAAPPGRRGVYVSIQYATQGVAILAAGIVGFCLSSLLSDAALESWGWRVAFLIGATIVPVGLYIRRRLPETLHDSRVATDPISRTRVPLTLIVLALLMLGSNTTGTYILNYMNTYAQDSLKLAAHLAFGATITMGICLGVASPVGGWLSDRMGPKPVMLSSVVATLVLALPCYIFLNQWRTAEALYAVTAVLAFVGQLALVAVMVAIAGALPKTARSAGIGMLYSGAVAFFGGSAQFLIKWLIDTTGSTLAPAWYLVGAMIVGGLAMLAFPAQSR